MIEPKAWIPAACAALLTGCASAPADAPTCPSDADIAANVQKYLALQPIPNPPATMTMEGAACGARKFTAALAASQGKVIGYKAGLTNPVVQNSFAMGRPLRGTLFEKTMLGGGAAVPARFGARPFLEADFVVEVGSSRVHDAKTPLEVLALLRAVYPFIELPDQLVQDPSRINGPTLMANNVGVRLGLLDAPIPVRTDVAFADSLRDVTVATTDDTGKALGTGKGSAILGHPLSAVMWLAADLARSGITFEPGDLLSLGTFTPGRVEAGRETRVTYDGLPGNPSVQVRFR